MVCINRTAFYVAVLRLRKEPLDAEAEKIIEANTDVTNLVMHKDSVWNQQWETFKNSKVGESKSASVIKKIKTS